MYNPFDRGSFLNLAACVEGGLIVVALMLAWGLNISINDSLHWNLSGLYWGMAGVVPMLGLFYLLNRFPVGSLYRIKRFLIDALGPSLNVCTWYDLILLAGLAGVGEELLFRGVVQPWFSRLSEGEQGLLIGIIGSNVLFGLAHSVTWTYAILAGIIGCYLSYLLGVSGEQNLVIPIIAHGVYDFIAFLVIKHSYRNERQLKSQPDASEMNN